MSITTIDPVTGETLQTYPTHTDEEIERLLEVASAATSDWGFTPVADREQLLRRLAAGLRQGGDELAELVTREMGKVTAEAVGELQKAALTCDFYADNVGSMLRPAPVVVEGAEAWVAYEPIGVVLAVMPWNFPVWQVMRFAIPAIAAGNGVLLKHSPNVSGTALAMQRIWEEAGLPPGVFTTLIVEEERVPAVTGRLIDDDRIAAVTLTGSNRAGSAVGAAAGRAVKKAVLELGGSDAFVVLADADVEKAAAAAVRARFHNAGQSCVCAKRFIVEEPVAEAFTRAFVSRVEALVIGDPSDPGTDMGPLARADLRDAIEDQVRRSVDGGARLLTGGSPVPGKGFFFQPTVLSVGGAGTPAFDEETFGPLATITVARDEADAVHLANATAFGLGLSVWGRDTSRAVDVARRVTSGAAFINAVVASDPRLPFGGTKRSGYGRELADVGLREFVNVRTYWTAEA